MRNVEPSENDYSELINKISETFFRDDSELLLRWIAKLLIPIGTSGSISLILNKAAKQKLNTGKRYSIILQEI